MTPHQGCENHMPGNPGGGHPVARTWQAGGGWSALFIMLVVPVSVAADAGPGEHGALYPPSWTWVPRDAAFYGVMLRNREQWQSLAQSRAWARLKSLPVTQMLWQRAQAELNKPGGPAAQFQRFYAAAENRQLLDLLADMLSEEVFVYGGSNFNEVAELVRSLSGMPRLQRFYIRMATSQGRSDANKAQIQALLDTLAESKDLIQVPELVIGFRVSKAEAASTQLARLEGLVKAALAQDSRFKGTLRRSRLAGGDFLTLSMDGQAVPWDQIPFQNWEDEPGQYRPLVEKLKTLKLLLAIGIRDGYVLAALGSSDAVLAKLGTGESINKLPEFKPLSRFAEQRLTAVTYASQALRVHSGLSKADVDSLIKTAGGYLNSAGLPDSLRKQIQQDLSELGRDIKARIRNAGATFAVSFLSERGQESYSYDWSEREPGEKPRPLTLLNHLGGQPVLAFVGRASGREDLYKLAVKWSKVAFRYYEEVAVPTMSEEQKQRYEEITKWLIPLLKRFDRATSQLLLPALRDGQWAFVLDAREASKQWASMMPAADTALPLPAPGLILGVSDADLLRQAGEEYRQVANEVLAKIKELGGLFVPEISINSPETKDVGVGKLYYYTLPAPLGLDPALLPNVGLSKSVVCLTPTVAQSTRILREQPLKFEGGPLSERNRPATSAVYLNWPALVDAALPWVEYAVRVATSRAGAGGDKDAAQQREQFVTQARAIGEVMKVLRGAASLSYVEDGATVTHSEVVIRDLP